MNSLDVVIDDVYTQYSDENVSLGFYVYRNDGTLNPLTNLGELDFTLLLNGEEVEYVPMQEGNKWILNSELPEEGSNAIRIDVTYDGIGFQCHTYRCDI